MAKDPGESGGKRGNEGAEVTELFPQRDERPTVADAETAGLDKPEMLIALMRGRLKPPGKDEPLGGGPSDLDMRRSRRIVDPDGKLISIGSLFEIEEQILEAARRATGNKRKPPSHTGGSDAAG